jgi:hypothetical protein
LVPPDLPEAGRAFIFQLGKALRRKLLHRDAKGRAYWQQPHVAGAPFVIAVGAFHDDFAQWHPIGLVTQYLYGTRDSFRHAADGTLTIESEPVAEHHHAGKAIPSGLFALPEAKHLSGVLFSNSHTVAIFNRIGVEQGLGSSGAALCRVGTCYDPDRNAATPRVFAYVVGDRPHHELETFTDGLHLLINPYATIPLLPDALPGISFTVQQPNGTIVQSLYSGLHAYMSRTFIFGGEHAAALARYQQLAFLGLLPDNR